MLRIFLASPPLQPALQAIAFRPQYFNPLILSYQDIVPHPPPTYQPNPRLPRSSYCEAGSIPRMQKSVSLSFRPKPRPNCPSPAIIRCKSTFRLYLNPIGAGRSGEIWLGYFINLTGVTVSIINHLSFIFNHFIAIHRTNYDLPLSSVLCLLDSVLSIFPENN